MAKVQAQRQLSEYVQTTYQRLFKTMHNHFVNIMALMGITGNIDRKGGQVLFRAPKIRNVGKFSAHELLPKEQAAKRLGGDSTRSRPCSSTSPRPARCTTAWCRSCSATSLNRIRAR